MCNLETSITYQPGQVFNPTAIKELPDRGHCLQEVVYIGGSNDYNPGAVKTPVSLQPIRIQNRDDNTNYTPFILSGASDATTSGNYRARYTSTTEQLHTPSIDTIAGLYGSHAHENTETHAQHAH